MILKKDDLPSILSKRRFTMSKTKTIITSLGGALVLASATFASAGLYVYPVEGNGGVPGDKIGGGHDERIKEASYHSSDSPRYYVNEDYIKHEISPISLYQGVETLSRDSDLTINSSKSPSSASNLPCYGKNVPLVVALKEVYGDNYLIKHEPSLEKLRVSWETVECTSKEQLISIISDMNSIDVYVNQDENAIGVTKSGVPAKFYASHENLIWRTDPSKSVVENLVSWSESEGWKVEWPSIMNEVDFETADTVVYGELMGKEGVFHRVLKQISRREGGLTLSVSFYRNNYAVVSVGGYKIKGEVE